MAETAIDVRNVVKRFGSFTALERLSLSIQDNEFFTLLGPSGCGKTTLLRMIAGFDQVTEGEIFLFGEEIENLPPHQRPINMVFQNYALFPHMTIIENVMFGLQMRGNSTAKARSEAQKMLELVQLEQFMDRRPNQLSGGQQQRVALARALAPKPKLLLLDEPLSALDLKLRQAMRFELKEMQHKTGITFIFVTHDQEEALTMSDRIAVMSAGKLQQLGNARDIYETPVNRFVAGFIGETNLLDTEILQVDGDRAQCRLAENTVLSCQIATNAHAGEKGQISVRPERIHISALSGDKGMLPGVIRENTFVGTAIQTRVQLNHGVELFVKTPNSMAGNQSIFEAGATVSLTIEEGAARLLTA